MPRFLRSGFIAHDELFAGRWEPALETLLSQPPPTERPRVDGADVVAAALLEML
jgi:hypothetical protein